MKFCRRKNTNKTPQEKATQGKVRKKRRMETKEKTFYRRKQMGCSGIALVRGANPISPGSVERKGKERKKGQKERKKENKSFHPYHPTLLNRNQPY